MIKEIVKDIEQLEKILEKVHPREDVGQIVKDMLDTARFHNDNCLGLAANQVGYNKRIILVKMNGIDSAFTVMINPVIMKAYGKKYISAESCLSLEGARKTVRNSSVSVIYQDRAGKIYRGDYSGLTAKIIQHEVDHCNGIII